MTDYDSIIRKLPKPQRKMLDQLSCGGDVNRPANVEAPEV